MKITKLVVTMLAFNPTVFLNPCLAADQPAIPSPQPARPATRPLNEQATAEAWRAFQAGQYETAVTNTDQCIARFWKAADQIQAFLEADKEKLPMGAVSEAGKKRIAKYEVLHDVATCFLIKGWAEEKLGHKEEARKAYQEATRYTHARSSMPTGGAFWSQAESASECLAKLSKSSQGFQIPRVCFPASVEPLNLCDSAQLLTAWGTGTN